MAKIKLLIDTDIFIDALKEIKPAKELFRLKKLILYCSILTRKELWEHFEHIDEIALSPVYEIKE